MIQDAGHQLDGPAGARGVLGRWSPRGDSGDAGIGSGPETAALIDRILSARGLGDADAAVAFLSPTLSGLHDPSLIPGLDRSAERILAAARAGEPIVIYGDYDVDGVTAAAILVRALRVIAPDAHVSTYIPHRIDEGYGLSEAAIRELAANGARVIVSVDCGITAIGPAAAAREAGVDLIITDHHNPPTSDDDVPDAWSVVHPRLPGSAYPFGELCGAGVAFKLAWRLCTLACGSERVTEAMRTLLLDLMLLAALGTIADVVPLVDENRVIVRYGLARFKGTPVVGVRALAEACRIDLGKVDAERVGFMLAPRLNAVGRLGHARESLELLLTEDESRAAEIAEELDRVNEERRRTERAIFEAAKEMAEAAGMTGDDRRAIVLADEAWHPGVVGIVCSRLVEAFGRPAVLMQRQPQDDGTVLCAGSGRSIDGYSLHAGLESCRDLLVGFGGHDMAAGLRLDESNLDEFTERLIGHANAGIAADDLVRTVRYDCEAAAHELTPAAVREIQALAPFGRGNPGVRLLVRGLRVNGSPETFGKRGEHLSLRLVGTTPRGGRVGFRAVGWRWAARLAEDGGALGRTLRNAAVDAVLEPKVSDYSGQVEPVIEDLRVCGAGAGGHPRPEIRVVGGVRPAAATA